MDKQFALILLLITLPKMWSYSQTIVLDSTRTYNAPETIVKNKTDTITKRSFFKKFLDYFNDANKNKNHKKFDFSIIGGPHFSSDTKLGIGVVAAGLYRMDRKDTILPPSNISLYGDVSTTGFYLLGIRGNNLFPQNKYRLNYNFYFYSFPSLFWGIGYNNAVNNANKSKYSRFQAQVKVDFLFKLIKNLYVGPLASFDYIHGKDFKKPELLENMAKTTRNISAGMALIYDSRDFLTNAYRGYYLKLEQRFSPSFMGNRYAFSTTDLRTSYYHKIWKGGILAGEFHTLINTGNPPWGLMALLGSSYAMRGYYEGRYRDKDLIEIQLELRQHIWKRNGIVVWIGAGNIFNSFKSFHFNQTLPNYGFGYRWEFKKM